MSRPTAVLIDYRAGNLTSVALAVRHLGWEPIVTDRPDVVAGADRVIFPGVGAAGSAMDRLKSSNLGEALATVVRRGQPVLGICIGCQIILDRSEEDGGTSCLGLIPGEVRRFRFASDVRRKIPHMGWNEVKFRSAHPLLEGVPAGSQFYFVHSYYPVPADDAVVLGQALYGGVEFAAALVRENLAAVQFHAEKSGLPGLRLLENFLQWSP